MTATQKEEKLSLLEKISRMTHDIGDIKKGGTNTFQKYKYVKGEDAMSSFREVEVAHRVKVFPRIDFATLTMQELQTKSGGRETLCTAMVNFEICDLDSDNKIIVPIAAQGCDSQDKAVYKLMTGAFKYFVLQVFSASGDDPEVAKNQEQNNFRPQMLNQSQMAKKPPMKPQTTQPPAQKKEDKGPFRVSDYEGKKFIFMSEKPYLPTKGLLEMGFKPSKKNPKQLFKLYNPADEKYLLALHGEFEAFQKKGPEIVYDEGAAL